MNTKKFAVYLAATVIMVSAPAQAQADQWRDARTICSKLSDPVKRLTCYDQAASQQTDQKIVEGELPADKMGAAKKIDDFGKSHLKSSPVQAVKEAQTKAAQDDVEAITFNVVKHSYTASNKFVLYMANGQVWQQKDGGKIFLPKKAFDVKIKKGFMGSYNISLPNRRAVIKVKRLK